MKKERKDKSFIKKPVYPGGMEAMRTFIKNEMAYPPEARKNKISGVVKLRYTVDYKGNVIDVKLVKSIGFGCDEEAERIVRLFKFKVAKNLKGKVQFHKTINIHFQYHEEKETTVAHSISYQYQTTSNKTDEDDPQGGYHYQINW